jgi:hypothetical protein
MQSSDKKRFAKLMQGLAEYYDKTLTPTVLDTYWQDLEPYPFELVERVLIAHRRDPKAGAYWPKVSDVIGKISRQMRPSADEAWAMCPKDESQTVVWTREMCEAFSEAQGLLSDGDKVGARMAFKAAYERLTEAAMLRNDPPRWEVSLGFDPDLRHQAIEDAVRRGRLALDVAQTYAALAPPPSETSFALLEGKVQEAAKTVKQAATALANLRSLRERINTQPDAAEERRRQLAVEREMFERHRAEQLQRVSEYAADKGIELGGKQ